MLFWATLNQVSNIVRVKILDSAVSTGAGKTGILFSTSGLLVSTIASNEAAPTSYSGANLETVTTLGTYAAPTAGRCRFREVSAANHPGVYELQFANARFAVAGSRHLLISISGVSGAAQCDGIIPLPVQDLFAAGLSAQQQADVKSSVLPIFNLDAQTELGSGAPPGATATIFEKLNMLYKMALRKKTTDGTQNNLFNAAGTTVEQKQPISVAGGTVTKGQWVSGP
jgi:hypothetical protein